MAGYYMQFDRTANTIKVTPGQNGNKGPWATDNVEPTRVYGENPLTIGLLSMGIAICVIGIIVIAVLSCYFLNYVFGGRRSKTQELKSKLDQLIEIQGARQNALV